MVRRGASMSLPVIIALVLGCSGPEVPGGPDTDLTPGQEDFVTLEPGGQGASQAGRGVPGPGSPQSGSASGGGSGSSAPPSGRTEAVEEADIYRVDSNRLFYLNTYRGFVVYDLNDPAHPVQLGRLPVHGYPVEMFVQGNTVYALLRDVLYLTRAATGVTVTRRNVSQLLTIDVSDLSRPRILKTHDIAGQLREGVSRKIGDTIYVVSYMPQSYPWPGSTTPSPAEQAWVYSYSVANPTEVVEVDRLKIFEGGGGGTTVGSSSSGTYFAGIAISATANTLHVVENWHDWGSTGNGTGCSGSSSWTSRAVVSIVDISDPGGTIRAHARFHTSGSLTDQFKHTYVFDEASRKAHYLGIFARQDWQSSGCTGTNITRNTLEAWDVTDGARPRLVDSLVFGKPEETVRGSTFDLTRKVAYAITARRVDPLYAISFADPTDLEILSAIDGLSGDMSVFRLVDEGRYLLGIGQDNSETCQGFGSEAVGWSSNIAVSVIDVRDPTRTRLVQRRCVTVKDARWVSSQISWDLDQAHKMLGMFSDARANIITVPVNYYTKTDTDDGWYWYRPASAVGLMTYDVAADDPLKAPPDQAVLRSWGTVTHASGAVTRSILFPHQSSAGTRRMMVNLSDTHVSVVDIDDLANPVTRSIVEVAPYHARLYRFGAYIVDELQLGGGSWWQPGASEFRVKLAAPGLDEAAPVATFTVGRVDRVLQWKDLLLLFRPVGDPTTQGWRSSVTRTEVVAFDLSDPAHPRRRGTAELDFSVGTSYGFFCGVGAWGYWPGWGWYGTTTLATTAEGVAALVYRWDNGSYGQDLVTIDAANPDALRVSQKVLLRHSYGPTWSPPAVEYLGLLGGGETATGVVVTSRTSVGTSTEHGGSFTWYRYHAEHFDRSLARDWAVNTPGPAVRVFAEADTTRLLSLDTRYTHRPINGTSSWSPEQRLNLLTRRGSVARLDDSLPLGAQWLADVVGDTQRLFLNLSTWTSTSSGTLMTIDLSQDRLTPRFSGPLGLSYFQLMGLYGDRLFVSLPGDGVLVVDVARLEAPAGVNFLRTLGWATHLAFTGSMAFVAAGNFGVFELDLSGPATIAQE